ncbi:hypothetical protein IDH01_01635 [Pelagibacterales bacterium SAG-MED08]|nr:hypothetical protein [Pelagibacterales bacterium SAG-MED08]
MKKKFIYYIFFLSFLFCNSGISKEINNTYSCSQPDWIDEKYAKENKLGFWKIEFEYPWIWRKKVRDGKI